MGRKAFCGEFLLMTSAVCDRLTRLRQAMRDKGYDAWLVASADPHLCEYLPENWKFLRYLTGFTGSYGSLVVTHERALLWTDSRYWEQAAGQLEGSGIELMRLGAAGIPAPQRWLQQNLAAGSELACDTLTLTESVFERLSCGLSERGIEVTGDTTVMERVWLERPAAEIKPVFVFTNGQESVEQKVRRVREAVHEAGAEALLLCTLEDIAWLTNLRGRDIACTPVFAAYLTVTDEAVTLYVNPEKLTDPAVVQHLKDAGIATTDYAQCLGVFAQTLAGKRVLLDPSAVSHAVCSLLQEAGASIITGERPTTIFKSRKSRAELDLLREAMRQDGAALCEFYAQLEELLARGDTPTELELSELLHAERAKRPGFIEDSFPAIVAFGANAALPHYSPETGNNAKIERYGDTLLLIDSGGQYLTGTTDITRTIVIGNPTEAMRTDYTAVLRGHIALANAVFPKGAYGSQLDTLVRAPVWEIGADFGHGTGHGVGFVLSVHEGPVSISPRAPAKESAVVVPGLVLSNEPGIYRAGKYGIRTENLITPVPDETMLTAMQPMLHFETLTLIPYDSRLIKTGMMTPVEINWVNAYHTRVKEELMPLLTPRAQAWLERAAEII